MEQPQQTRQMKRRFVALFGKDRFALISIALPSIGDQVLYPSHLAMAHSPADPSEVLFEMQHPGTGGPYSVPSYRERSRS